MNLQPITDLIQATFGRAGMTVLAVLVVVYMAAITVHRAADASSAVARLFRERRKR